MADSAVGDPVDHDMEALPFPEIDPTFFTQHLPFPDHDQSSPNHFLSFDENDVVDGFDVDFTFDDLFIPSDSEPVIYSASNPTTQIECEVDSDSINNKPVPEPELRQITVDQRSCGSNVSISNSPESGDRSSSGGRVLDSVSPELGLVSGNQSLDVSDYLNVPVSESDDLNQGCSQELDSKDSTNCDRQVSGPASSQGSGNFDSNVSQALNYLSPDSGNCDRSTNSSPSFENNMRNGVVDQEIKMEEMGSQNCLLKRKKENEDLLVCNDSRTSKYRKSNNISVENSMNEEDDKRKARLIRNRESAQLSRQRKKHYVDELEDKVRNMHSTIQDLNAKISYMMAENAGLRHQLGGNGMCNPAQMPPPPGVGMYLNPTMAPMAYPWMPGPPYMVKPQGSQVPLVPIPRLKPQQPKLEPKPKKIESKRRDGKTKKVASVSFLGLVFFIFLFGGLVPMVNVNYGGMREAFTGGLDYVGTRLYDQHHGRVLTVSGHVNGTHPVLSGNSSGPLLASLYVPRNDKLVKIDGNLIIHSVMASEKAMASCGNPGVKLSGETSLAVPGNLAQAIHISSGRHPHLYRSPTEQQRALASGSGGKDNLKSTPADGKLQQWFREGLAGPLLSSGMCTEVFQFDVSPAAAPGAVFPAPSVRNVSAEHHQNSTHPNKVRNRRILNGLPIPLPGSSHNLTEEHTDKNSEKEHFHGNNSLSSMVVSVLVDPKEAGDSDGDGMMGGKSLSRIFVVVLMDSVRYVTYSCMLPLKGSGPHLVTT